MVMISIYLRDSVLTTQSRTIIVDLKPKMKENEKNVFKKMYVFCTWLSQFNSRTCF